PAPAALDRAVARARRPGGAPGALSLVQSWRPCRASARLPAAAASRLAGAGPGPGRAPARLGGTGGDRGAARARPRRRPQCIRALVPAGRRRQLRRALAPRTAACAALSIVALVRPGRLACRQRRWPTVAGAGDRGSRAAAPRAP